MGRWFGRSRQDRTLRRGDIALLDPLRAAQVVEEARAATWALYLLLAVVVAAVVWAWTSQVDIIARADARVVPDGKEQLIASLEGGILRELKVREGEQVSVGSDLALLDPTRFEVQQAEGNTRRIALMGTLARLQAESTGQPLRFPPDVQAVRAVVEGETESFRARQTALQEAVALQRRSMELLRGELNVAEAMASKGLMSEVEVMRVRRQLNELSLMVQDRLNRFRQDASAELVKVRNELTLVQDQMVVRDDQLARTVLKSPVNGIVKRIMNHTIGGVISPGAPLMEIVPLGPQVLVEARVRPADIGFIKVGQEVKVKLSAYEFTIYGGLTGTVMSISPDALVDGDRRDGSYYRALVRADASTLRAPGVPGEKPLQVLPGMNGTAEIRTGQRSVLAFVLRPMLKTSEAFRER